MTWKNRNENNSTNYEHPKESNLWELHKAMDYDAAGRPVIRIDDTTAEHTSTNRVKVSTKEIAYFNTFQYSKDSDIWDEQATGTGSITFDPYLGQVIMQVGSNAGDQIIQQSRRVIRYIPSRQNELAFAVRFTTPTPGVRRRIGLFDELNGFYFEDGGDGNYYCVLRRNTPQGVVEDRVARADWNYDRLDGTGPSTIVADPEAQQMVTFEYDWYGAGQVEIAWVIGNQKRPIHQFNTANNLNRTWSSTAFLPVRKELTNITGAPGPHRMYVGSTSISTEGVTTRLGRDNNINSPITGKSTGNTANTFVPILSIRMRADRLAAVIIPLDFQAATLDNTAIFFRLVKNAVLANASWSNVPYSDLIEYDTSATAATNGTVLKTGYLSPSNQGDIITFDPIVTTQLGRTNMGTASDIITIEVASVQANKSAFASINWIELR